MADSPTTGTPAIGVVYPQTELGGDVAALRAYALGVQAMGFDHLMAYDHVVGADRAEHAGFKGPYDVDTTFHEPMVLFGFLAGITDLELVSGVFILPQRQTVLAAKQAAEIDLLTGGRFRMGVGVGWNAVEYEALGMEFGNRGRRFDEQIELMRRLWTERSVTHHGRFETVTGAGLAPMPIQRPIPVWIGAQSPAAYRRVGRLADGWFPQMPPGADLDAAWAIIAAAAADAGRNPSDIAIDARVSWRGEAGRFVDQAGQYRAAGASYLSINTMGAGLTGVDDHLAALQAASDALRP
ncbi:MAG: luciferase-like monooxygenase [Jatrophihabitantaceae bacterium]|nr:luciferase-like monooxygenase [Jatrophihabitantaceae bacterium]